MKKNCFISLLLCVCMVMSLFVGLTGPAGADDGDVIDYTVKDGDYLFKVCQKHGLNYYQVKGAIMTLNGFTSEQQLNKISVGQHIQLPATNAVAATVKSSTVTTTTVKTSTTVGGTTTTTTTVSTLTGDLGNYTVAYYLVPVTVKNGDTLNTLCNELGTSYYNYANVILRVNGLGGPNSLQAGSTIYLPTTKPFTAGSGYAVIAHSVATGENLTKICEGYGLNYQAATTKTLVEGVNPNKNLNMLWSGDVIYIPKPVSAVVTTVSPGTGSSSSTPAVQTGYQIAIYAAENGSPYAVVGSTEYATRAEAGKSVVIKTNPDPGYAVKSIKVVRTDSGANVIVSDNSFTMPASNVQITVTYAKGLKIQKATSAYGSFDALVYGNPVTSAFYGDEVVVSSVPYSGYSVNAVYYVRTSNPATRKDITADKSGVYKFNMPGYDITLYVEFKLTTYHNLSAFITGRGSVTFTVDGKEVTKAEKGKTVTATVSPASGWELDERLSLVNPNPQFWNGMTPFLPSRKVANYQYTFEVGNEDITLKVTFDNVTRYSLSAPSVTGGYVYFRVTDAKSQEVRDNANSAKPGDKVDILYHAKGNYIPQPATTPSRTTIASTGAVMNTALWTNPGYSFTMPDADVIVKTVFQDTGGAVNWWYLHSSHSPGGKGTMFFSDVTAVSWNAAQTDKVQQGAPVDIHVYIKPIENYAIQSVTMTIGSTTTTLAANATAMVTNPNTNEQYYVYDATITGEATIKATYVENYEPVPVYAMWDVGVGTSQYANENVVLNVRGNHVAYAMTGTESMIYTDPLGTTINFVPGYLGAPGYAGIRVCARVNLSFNVKDNYRVVSVMKTGGSLPFGQWKVLTGGNYEYQITLEDYKGIPTNGPIIFSVVTETTGEIGETAYKVQYNNPDPTGGIYTITVTDKNTGVAGAPITADAAPWESEAIAHPGDTVVLNITANAGFALDQVIKNGITVNGADIKAITATTWRYTFEMPEGNVTTQVLFKSVPTALAIAAGGGANAVWHPDQPLAAGPGELVTAKVRPTWDFAIVDSVTITPATTWSISDTPDDDGYYTLTFTMPTTAVTTLNVDFRLPTVTYTAVPGFPSTFTWGGGSPLSALAGAPVTINYSFTTTPVIEEIKTVGGLEEVDYNVYVNPATGAGTITFIMPKRDVTLTVSTGLIE